MPKGLKSWVAVGIKFLIAVFAVAGSFLVFVDRELVPVCQLISNLTQSVDTRLQTFEALWSLA